MDSWAEAPLLQVTKDLLVYSGMFSNRVVFHRAYNNSICVIDVTHNYVVVAPAGNGCKTTSEIHGKKITWFDHINVDSFGPSDCCLGWIRGNWEVWGRILRAG